MLAKVATIQKHFVGDQELRGYGSHHPAKNVIFASNFKSIDHGRVAHGSIVQTPTNVCRLGRGRYAVNPGDATGNQLVYAATNSFPQGDLSCIIEFRPDRDGTVAAARVLLNSEVGAGAMNRTQIAILGNAETLRLTHTNPAGAVHCYVEAAITGGLVAGRLYRWLFLRDDDGVTLPAYLGIRQWDGAAWQTISGALTAAFTAHTGVPAELRVGNSPDTSLSCWGAFEAIGMKDSLDAGWDPNDGQLVTDSTWAAVYRQSGSLDANKTTGGDSVVATVTGFVAISLATDAMWQNRDAIGNRITVTVTRALGLNRGAICCDLTPLVLPAARRSFMRTPLIGAGNQLTAFREVGGPLRFYFSDNGGVLHFVQTVAANLLAVGTRSRCGYLWTPPTIFVAVDEQIPAQAPTGVKGLRGDQDGKILIPGEAASNPMACLVENLHIYDKAEGTDAWCRREFLFARRHSKG